MNRPESFQPLSDASLTPEMAVARLIDLHDGATAALHGALDRFFQARIPPSIEERRRFRYPSMSTGPAARLPWRSGKPRRTGTKGSHIHPAALCRPGCPLTGRITRAKVAACI